MNVKCLIIKENNTIFSLHIFTNLFPFSAYCPSTPTGLVVETFRLDQNRIADLVWLQSLPELFSNRFVLIFQQCFFGGGGRVG